MFQSRALFIVAALTAFAVAACNDDDPASPSESVLAGLSPGNSNDTTSGNPIPTTPGSFHGFVVGRGTGPDTFATAPRIPGATITAYPHLGFDGDTPRLGASAGSVTTDANGFFQFPTIPGGPYVVTIKPPGSEYQGQYTLTTISNVSNSGNWWVVLSR